VPCPLSLKRSHGGLYGTEFASPEGACAVMVRLESLPGEEQPLRDADVVSWQLGQEMSAHHKLYNTKKEGCLSGGSGVALQPRLPGARPAGRRREPSGLWGHIRISGSATPSSATFGTRSRRALRRCSSSRRTNPALDRAADKFRDTDAEIIRTSLSKEHEARLREAFAQYQRPTAARPGAQAGPAPDPVTLTAQGFLQEQQSARPPAGNPGAPLGSSPSPGERSQCSLSNGRTSRRSVARAGRHAAPARPGTPPGRPPRPRVCSRLAVGAREEGRLRRWRVPGWRVRDSDRYAWIWQRLRRPSSYLIT
jgi:hypothetical protein